MHPSNAHDRPRVVVLGLPAAAIDRLRAAAPSLAVDGYRTLRDADARLPDAVALIGWASAAAVRRATHLRWVHLAGAGVERFLFPELAESSIVITCERGIHGESVADHAMALLLALTRGLGWARDQQRGEVWVREPPRPLHELTGKTAVILGFGGIGRAIAARARGFGLRIIGVAREAPAGPPPEGVSRIVGVAELDQVLPRAEVLFVALPQTPATVGLIDAVALARLPAGALVINVGRGPLVDTDALTRALERGHLGGAGLDVSEPEPLPPGHPLWRREDVVITPHVAGISDRTEGLRVAFIADNLRRFAAGAPLRGVVERERGY